MAFVLEWQILLKEQFQQLVYVHWILTPFQSISCYFTGINSHHWPTTSWPPDLGFAGHDGQTDAEIQLWAKQTHLRLVPTVWLLGFFCILLWKLCQKSLWGLFRVALWNDDLLNPQGHPDCPAHHRGPLQCHRVHGTPDTLPVCLPEVWALTLF